MIRCGEAGLALQAEPMIDYTCRACGATLLVRVPFKGRFVWEIDRDDPDFSTKFPDPQGEYGAAKVVCSADPLHRTGFHLIDGSVERDLSSKAWD